MNNDLGGRRVLTLATAVLVVVVAGVGVGAVATGVGAPPSKATFLAEADGICRQADAPTTSLAAPTSFPELSDAAKSVAAATEAQVVELDGLDRPSGGKPAIDAVLASLRGTAASAKALQGAASTNDEKGTAHAADDMSARARAAADGARTYGFTVCGTSTATAVRPLFDGANKVIKAGFLPRANAICQQASAAIDDVPNPDSNTSLARALGSYATIVGTAVRDIRALTVPPGDDGAVREALEAMQTLIDSANKGRDAALGNNIRLVAALSDEFNRFETAANAKADAYGLVDCGTNSSI